MSDITFTKGELKEMFDRPSPSVVGWYKQKNKNEKDILFYCVDCALKKQKTFTSDTSLTAFDLAIIDLDKAVCDGCGKDFINGRN